MAIKQSPQALVPADLQRPFLLPKTTGYYYGTPMSYGAAQTGRTMAVNTTYYVPIYFDGNITYDRIAIKSFSSWATGPATVRLGIYNASLTTGRPDTVYLDAGTISVTAANTDQLITISTTPPAGYYYLAMNSQVAASTNNYEGPGNNAASFINGFASDTIANLGLRAAFEESKTVTSGFTTAGTLTPANIAGIPFIKVRAV
jgi:hypothetical protein